MYKFSSTQTERSRRNASGLPGGGWGAMRFFRDLKDGSFLSFYTVLAV